LKNWQPLQNTLLPSSRLRLPIHFTDSSNKIALKTFREQHGIKTVPALLKISQGKIKSVCNSKLSEEEIEAFLSV